MPTNVSYDIADDDDVGGMGITGKSLIEMGIPQGPWYKYLINYFSHVPTQTITKNYVQMIIDDNKLIPEVIPLQNINDAYFHDHGVFANLDAVDAARAITTIDMLRSLPYTETVSGLADFSLTGDGASMPVGCVVRTRGSIHPGLHSSDVACGVHMSKGDNLNYGRLTAAIQNIPKFGPGGMSDEERKERGIGNVPPYMLENFKRNMFLNDPHILEMARTHFATCGDGNHFVTIGQYTNHIETRPRPSNKERLGIVTHFGSRGVGAALYKKGMKAAIKHTSKICPDAPRSFSWLDLGSHEGLQYMEALKLVMSWTERSHHALHSALHRASVTGRTNVVITKMFSSVHNTILQNGRKMIHLKGANLSSRRVEGAKGPVVIPIRANEPILVVRNSYGDDSPYPHGGGRIMSRTTYEKELRAEYFAKKPNATEQEFLIESRDSQMGDICKMLYQNGNIDVSELPNAYRSSVDIVDSILEEEGEIIAQLTPRVTIMAGKSTQPWKNKGKVDTTVPPVVEAEEEDV